MRLTPRSFHLFILAIFTFAACPNIKKVNSAKLAGNAATQQSNDDRIRPQNHESSFPCRGSIRTSRLSHLLCATD